MATWRSIHNFSREEIDNYVDSKGGNYLLGTYNFSGDYVVRYVGRATNLNKRLKEHLNDPHRYKWFRVLYEPDEVKRYYTECKYYHYWSEKTKLYNEIHPDKPNGCGNQYVCPVCGR